MCTKKITIWLFLLASWTTLPAQSERGRLNKYNSYIREGRSAMEAFRYSKAIDWFKAAEAILPDSQQVARSWIIRAENEQTLQLIKYSSRLDSLVKSTRLEKMTIQYANLLSLGRTEMVQANYQRANELFEQALAFCEEELVDTLDNDCEQARLALAESRQKATLGTNFQNLLNEGNEHFINDRPRAAMQKYEEALQLGFNNRKVRERLDMIRLKYGNLSEEEDSTNTPSGDVYNPPIPRNNMHLMESFRIDGLLKFEQEKGSISFITQSVQSPKSSLVDSKELRVSLSNGNLLISYARVSALPLDIDSALEFTAFFEGNPVSIPDYQLTHHTFTRTADSIIIIWHDFLENLPDINGRLQLEINNNIYIRDPEFDCYLGRPTFSFNQQAPYYISAGAGLFMLGTGFVVRNNSKILFDEYGQNNDSGTLDRANRLDRSATVLQASGIALMAISGGVLLFKYSKYKRNARIYDQYCTGQDMLSINLSSIPNGIGAGPVVQLTFKF